VPRMPLPGTQRGRQSSQPARCWLWALAEVEALKQPFRFTRCHDLIELSDEAAVATNSMSLAAGDTEAVAWATALGGAVMRAGQHYCEFTWLAGSLSMVGVVTDSSAANERVARALDVGELWLTPSAYFYSTEDGHRVHWGDEFSWSVTTARHANAQHVAPISHLFPLGRLGWLQNRDRRRGWTHCCGVCLWCTGQVRLPRREIGRPDRAGVGL
jgi:hypothetical protein